MNVYTEVQAPIIDGWTLRQWLRKQPGLENFEIIPHKPFDCTGESKFTAEVYIENDPTITTDPKTLTTKDVMEYQRGNYHHVYIQDVLDFAYKCGIIKDTYVFVIYKW